MSAWHRRIAAWLGGTRLPSEFIGRLSAEENVLAIAEARQGLVVATSIGLWLPETESTRYVGWHMINKASWREGSLAIVEAEELALVGQVMVLADCPTRHFELVRPGRLPGVVQQRITHSITSRQHRDLPGGGAWFVQRKQPGRNGIIVQARVDPGTDHAVVCALAAEISRSINKATAAN